MTVFLWFLVGLFIGGLSMTVILCCLQLHRTNEYEAEVQRLLAELNNK